LKLSAPNFVTSRFPDRRAKTAYDPTRNIEIFVVSALPTRVYKRPWRKPPRCLVAQ
jgi:hypothetical protein